MRRVATIAAVSSTIWLNPLPAFAQSQPLTKENCKDICRLGTATPLSGERKKLFNACMEANLCGQAGGPFLPGRSRPMPKSIAPE